MPRITLTPEEQDIVRRAQSLYKQRLQAQLEPTACDQFVAIEPTSGDYFLGATMHDAISTARATHPDRLVHVIRVGHRVAVEIGSAFS